MLQGSAGNRSSATGGFIVWHEKATGLLPSFCPGRSVQDGYRLAAHEILEQAVALAFDVPARTLRSHTRGKARVALARQIAMYLAHVVYGQSFTAVGIFFGRDRTTVAHACGAIEDRRDDPCFDKSIDQLETALCKFAAASIMLAPMALGGEEAGRDAR